MNFPHPDRCDHPSELAWKFHETPKCAAASTLPFVAHTFRDCGTLSNPRRGLLDTSRHHISYRGPAWGMKVGTSGVSSELRSLSVTFRCRLLMTSVVYCWSH